MGGRKFGIYPHVVWRVPPESKKNERDDGMINSQKNIDFSKKNTAHTRSERSSHLAVVVIKNFLSSTMTAQAIFEFITGDQLSTTVLQNMIFPRAPPLPPIPLFS